MVHLTSDINQISATWTQKLEKLKPHLDSSLTEDADTLWYVHLFQCIAFMCIMQQVVILATFIEHLAAK